MTGAVNFKQPHQLVFDAVKKDNFKAFCELVKNDKAILTMCFGRFPLLSLCYLFRSKKIVKAFEKRLNDVVDFQIVDEPEEAYQKFKTAAGKNLRFFVFAENKTVSPLEMLAVLKDFFYLECVYKNLRKSEKIKENVEKIVKNDGFCFTQTADSILVAKKPLSKFQRLALLLVFVVCAVFAVFPVVVLALASDGSEARPLSVASAESLLAVASKEDKFFELTADIDLSDKVMPAEFLANLDGKGHKVVLDAKTPFADILKGSIQNVEFAFENTAQAISVSESRGFVVNTNDGKIDNVKISFANDISVEANQPTTIALFAGVNNGEITNSTAMVDISILGSVESDTFFAAFAGENKGTIDNCSLLEGSKIVCDTVDVGGVVATNFVSAVVSNCTNFADVSHTTSSNSWNPLIGGVVLQNGGSVENCFNFGNLSAVSTASNLSYASLQIVVGGIVAYNRGMVSRCVNFAEIFAESNHTMVFAGGVVGGNGDLSYYGDFDSVVDNCGSFGKITVNNSVEYFYIFGGGISGYNTGMLKNSFSDVEITSNYAYSFCGGVSGLSGYYVNASNEIISQNSSNAFVISQNLAKGSGFLSFTASVDGDAVSDQLDDYEKLQAVNSLAELKQLEIFWEKTQ